MLAGIVLGEWERIQRKEYMEVCSLSRDEIWRIAENFEKDYNIIVTADHGGHERSHGSTEKEDMLIPIVCMGSDFEAGRKYEHANICDIPPTIAALMGVKANGEWEGKSLLC